MTMERRDFPVEIRAADDEKLEGHAAVFNSDSVDLGGFIERIAPGAFSRSVSEAESGKAMIHALWSHDPAIPLGSIRGGKLRLAEDGTGLAFTLSPKRLTPAQLDAVRDGDMRMSFGFRTRKDSWEKREGKNVRTLIDVDLFEVSLVASPAYPDTTVALRSMEAFEAEQAKSEGGYLAVTAAGAEILREIMSHEAALKMLDLKAKM